MRATLICGLLLLVAGVIGDVAGLFESREMLITIYTIATALVIAGLIIKERDM